MHCAMINEKRQSLIYYQNDCYQGAIRKIRDLFYSVAGLSCEYNFKYSLNLLPAASGTHVGEYGSWPSRGT